MANIFVKRSERINEFKEIRNKSKQSKKVDIPDGLYEKCPTCNNTFHIEEKLNNLSVCPFCNEHFRISAYERINMTLDDNYSELDENLTSANPLGFPEYEEKIEGLRNKTELNEAVVTGVGTINGEKTVIAVLDSYFLMGSMGSVVGEKVTRAIEYAISNNLPIIIFSASGGARMQEGILSLMQMAKTSGAIAKHNEKGLLYISVLTHPTTGGVTASFATLGDIILAEPEALIGFAGPRVIKQTIKQDLPEGFQKSEFQLEKGFVDKIVERKDMREVLSKLLKLHKREE